MCLFLLMKSPSPAWQFSSDSERSAHQQGSEEWNCDGNESHDHDIDGSVDEARNPAIGDVPLHHLVFEHVIDWHGICIHIKHSDRLNAGIKPF